MAEWRKTILGQVAHLQRGHDLPEPLRNPGSVPVMGSFGITGWHSEARAKGPGVTVGRSGASIGVVSFIDRDYWPLNTCLFVTDFHGNNPRFVYYLLKTIDLAGHNSGSAQPSLNRNFIHPLPLAVPEREEQDAIAILLGGLDDKVELNRTMNAVLEALTRTIFKDWFVDFGPVRAKTGGQAPYLVPELWALFPDTLDGEDRPYGWRNGRLSDLATPVGQHAQPNAMPPDTPYIGLEHMPRRSIALDNWDGAQKVTSGKLSFRRGDFLFGKLRPYFHKVGIAPLDGICSTDIIVLGPKNQTAAPFLLCCISADEFIAYTDQTSGGTKMPRTSWEMMGRYELCLPPDGLMTAFQQTVAPLLNRIISNIHESRTLVATRNLLLPKLMSGEIRLRDAEKLVERVA